MDESKFFYVCDGQVLRNMKDLAGSLEHDMSDETFKLHCNTEKNDFANWLTYALGKPRLSKNISRVKTRKGMLNKIKKKK